ncbi:MAG: glycosyltransferase [Opitutaceae bacterium]|nr:glycosyltransferase [Opitutaceae bacterium]
MRLAQIVSSLEARHGGPSRSVLGLAAQLAAAGNEVDLLTTASGLASTEQPVANFCIRRFVRQWPHSLAVSAPLHQYLQLGDHDLIHQHALWQRPLHYASAVAAKRKRPLVISPRGMMSQWAWRHHRWKKFLASHFIHPGAFATAAGWHATSEQEAADIRRLGMTQPICIAPNGVELPTPTAMETARQYWQQHCPELAGHRVALFYSRFHPKKRVLELIELWAAQAPSDWLLLVVGIPETYSIAELTGAAHRLGAANRIKVHDGTHAPAPYAVASVYLLPTHSENFGLTVAEALAHGLPVLTTDGTPWHELATKDSGFCVPWSEYGKYLKILLNEEPARLHARGSNGRAWMQAQFSWDKPASLLATFYKELLEHRRP